MQLNSSLALPLVVDLDGTLIKTDLLIETSSKYLIDQPSQFYKLIQWLFKGRTVLKENLARSVALDFESLPYNTTVLAYINSEKEKGRTIILATASHRILAEQVAKHLGLFDKVFASDHEVNLKGDAKRDILVQQYGERGFEYIGNDWPDISIWKSASSAHVVSRSSKLLAKAKEYGNLGLVLNDEKPAVSKALFKAMRPHQWMKNLLILVPLLAAHQLSDFQSLSNSIIAFMAFGLVASSVYLLNDLADVEDDRHHKKKRHRPFAAGNLSQIHGWIAWPTLLTLGFLLSNLPGGPPLQFSLCLAVYVTLTVLYSFKLKQIPIVDVLALAMLYTLRIIAGAAAISVPLSFWLLSFSMFFFTSLAFIKRYSELHSAKNDGKSGNLRGRGYQPQDLNLVSSLGASSGYTAVLVLALYIQDSHTASLYSKPAIIWLACPVLLFWISRAWLIAHRGLMHEDPIVFALKDKTSWLVAGLFAAVFVLAKVVA
jgi:4-hydroxybenzoate polyprenyltransferase/phosphoserine phosphatase